MVRPYKIFCAVILVLIGLGFFVATRPPAAEAGGVETAVMVVNLVCGDGVVVAPEVCDDGVNNGSYGYCKTDCTGLVEYCGDGICNGPETAATCSPDCTTGGGGGNPLPTTGQISFQGLAFPYALVTIVKNGQVAITVSADSTGSFTTALGNLTPGTYTFIIYGDDSAGARSASLTVTLAVVAGSTTAVSGLFLPPTISTNVSEVKQGNTIDFYGYTLPYAQTSVQIRNTSGTIMYNFTTAANALGQWTYSFNSTGSPYGDYMTQVQAISGGEHSVFSKTISFTIGAADVVYTPPTCLPKADLNCDGRVNIVDFSIAAYWWQRPLTADAITKVDNKLWPDGVVNLRDFSVMAYYWTG